MSVLQLKTLDGDIMRDFYSLPKNSLDAVYIGPSSVYRFWIGPEAFHNHGITAYGLSTSAQPISAAKFLMNEADKTQHPKLYIIDLRSVTWTDYTAGDIRKVTDNMSFSFNRIDAINTMPKSVGLESKTFNLEYYLSFIKYHGRWTDTLTKDDFTGICTTDEFENYMGYAANNNLTTKVNTVSKPHNTSKKQNLSALNKKYLVDLLEYCLQSGKKVLFTISPFSANKLEAEELNEAKSIAAQYGFPILDGISKFNEIGMNCRTDYYSARHTNVYGAQKYTNYLANYLVKTYHLPDHRGDAAYSSWEDSYKAFLKRIAEYKAES